MRSRRAFALFAVVALALSLTGGPLVSTAWTADTHEQYDLAHRAPLESGEIGNEGIDNGGDDTGDPDDWAGSTPLDGGLTDRPVAGGSGSDASRGAAERTAIPVPRVHLRVLLHVLVVTFAVR